MTRLPGRTWVRTQLRAAIRVVGLALASRSSVTGWRARIAVTMTRATGVTIDARSARVVGAANHSTIASTVEAARRTSTGRISITQYSQRTCLEAQIPARNVAQN